MIVHRKQGSEDLFVANQGSLGTPGISNLDFWHRTYLVSVKFIFVTKYSMVAVEGFSSQTPQGISK